MDSCILGRTRELIERGHHVTPLAAVCWSGGKDSMVLLHLMRSMGLQLPVVFFREPWQPRKYAFHDQLIRDWELRVISWHPTEVAYQQGGDGFSLQNWYRIGRIQLTCPSDILPPADDLPWVCGLEMGNRPLQGGLETNPPLQALWIGHKRGDRDVMLGGDAGTRANATLGADGSALYFPLRDWSDADVWEYIEEFNVPYDSERYEKHEGVWRERPDRRHNADYVHACTACMDNREDAPRFVRCPKLNGDVENIASRLPWATPEKLSYMEDSWATPRITALADR